GGAGRLVDDPELAAALSKIHRRFIPKSDAISTFFLHAVSRTFPGHGNGVLGFRGDLPTVRSNSRLDASANGTVLQLDLAGVRHHRSRSARLRYLSKSNQVRRFRSISGSAALHCAAGAWPRFPADANWTVQPSADCVVLGCRTIERRVDAAEC